MDYKFPVGVVGPGGAGKTTLIKSALQGLSPYVLTIYEKTIGFTKLLKKVTTFGLGDVYDVKLGKMDLYAEIWDFGGQEDFYEFVSSILMSTNFDVGNGYTFVIDSTKIDSLDNLINKWFPLIKSKDNKYPPSTLYISKLLLRGSQFHIPQEFLTKEDLLGYIVKSDYFNGILKKVENYPFVKAIFVGDSIGNEYVPPCMFAVKGPYEGFIPIETHTSAPIYLSSIYGLEHHGLTRLFNEETKKLLGKLKLGLNI